MKWVFSDILAKHKKRKPITIVSGLPRSGTSMMMRMLEAGGISIVTDNKRKADQDNPRGYYELEKVKKVKEDSTWLEKCRGKAFKMVSMLLYDLPPNEDYKIIFVQRNMAEMLDSQKIMLRRRGKDANKVSDDQMAQTYEKHLQVLSGWIAKQANFDVIYVKYNDVINNPSENAARVARFLKNRLDIDKMAAVVEKSLYRQRRK
jgi:hypothetical protein